MSINHNFLSKGEPKRESNLRLPLTSRAPCHQAKPVHVNFAQNQAVTFIGCLGACVLNTPQDIYNDVVIINNDHPIIVMMSF